MPPTLTYLAHTAADAAAVAAVPVYRAWLRRRYGPTATVTLDVFAQQVAVQIDGMADGGAVRQLRVTGRPLAAMVGAPALWSRDPLRETARH